MNKICIKSISVILSLAMVLTSADFGYGSTLFKTTSHAQRHLVENTVIENTCIVKDPALVSIPQSLGTIVEYFKGGKDSLIIHIQDRHIDPTAQLNIAGIIDEFISKHKVSLMCLEGASAELDTSFYDKFEDNDIKHKVSKAFVDFAIFTGPEHYKITNKDKYLIATGVEDKELYLKHLDTHKNTVVYQEGIINFLKAVNSSLNKLKDTLYTKDLKRIDNASISYSKGAIKLPEYIKTLNSYANKAGIYTSKYPNLIKFIALVQREEKIDFKLAEAQREAIIKRLSETLDRVELNQLLRNSMDFRTNKLSQEEFYDYLFNLIDKHDFKQKEYSQLQAYRDYIKLSKDINHLKVFDEADDFEYELMIALSNTQPQKDLVLYSKSAKLLQDLYSLKLTPRQLHYLEKHKDSSDIANIKRFLITTSSQYGLNVPTIINSFNINSYIMEQSKQYYSLALERDTALIENTLQRMRRLRNDKAILVAGGFHTQGITSILKERGISYVVICPNICHGDYDAIYNDRIAGKLPSIEQLESALSETLVAPLETGLPKTASGGAQELFAKAIEIANGDRTDKTSSPGKTILPESLPDIVPDNKLSQELDIFLSKSKDRTLLVSPDIEAIDQELKLKADKEGRKYLRITVKNENQMNQLLNRAHINQDGKVSLREGPLKQILKEGGVLLIDYSGSNSLFIEQFNSLFDSQPSFGNDKVSEKLSVLGVAGSKKDIPNTSIASRSRTGYMKAHEYTDPVHSIAEAPQGTGIRTIGLFGNPNFRYKLLGRPYINTKGKFSIDKGPLVEAATNGLPIIISGDSWENPEFLQFIRSIILHRSIEFNGHNIPVAEGFNIYRQNVDYRQGISNKKIISPAENIESSRQAWIVNSQTQDMLFSVPKVTDDGKLVETEGLLSSEKLRLRVTGKLADWVWHEIMHNTADIEIEVDPGVYVPSEYAFLCSEGLKLVSMEQKLSAWEQVKQKQVVLIEGNDTSFVHDFLSDEFGNDIVWVPVSPGTTVNKLIKSLETDRDKYASRTQGLLDALNKGKTVVLMGAQANPLLLEQLGSVLCEKPYLMANARRIEAGTAQGQWRGRLIITKDQQTKDIVRAANHVHMESDKEKIKNMLARRFPDVYNDKEFDEIMKLKELLTQQVPSPEIERLYPQRFELSFAQLEMLYSYRRNMNANWLEAFENVIISQYNGSKEIASFIRTAVRIFLKQEETGHKPNSLHGRKLMRVLSTMRLADAQDISWQMRFWELADTLSLDLLTKAFDKADGNLQSEVLRADIFETIRNSLVLQNQGTKRSFYKHMFGFDKVPEASALLDMSLRSGEENWKQKREHIIKTLKHFNAVFFRGPPGTGKSYISEELAEDLGFKPEDIIGPVTVGMDVSEDDFIGRRLLKDGITYDDPEPPVSMWIPESLAGTDHQPPARSPRLFIIDEANLAPVHFWNFLKAFFNKDPMQRYLWINGQKRWFAEGDRIIFTGNQETLADRNFQELFRKHVITINFDQFDEDFFSQQLKGYIHADKNDHEALTGLALELHLTFTRIDHEIDFSLRDLQELAGRINLFTGNSWTKEEVVMLAWQQYRGLFPPLKAKALEQILAKKFGVNIPEQEDKAIKGFIGTNRKALEKKGLRITDSVARMGLAVDVFLEMRQARLRGDTMLAGKRGMILEGPSGRGKDYMLDAFLEGKKVYRITASPRVNEVVDMIKKAQKDGAIVIISEMNLLPSGFLEGKLNDLLTGKAHPGFTLFATINSEDFSARQKLSSALKNRVIFYKLAEYSQKELSDIAHARNTVSSRQDVDLLVRAHCWIRHHIEKNTGRTNESPTLRNLYQALDVMEQEKTGWKQALEDIYRVFYLDHDAVKGKPLPVEEDLAGFEEPYEVTNNKLLQEMSSYIAGKQVQLVWDDITENGGYCMEDGLTIAISTKNSPSDIWVVADHEAGHSRFTRSIRDLGSKSNEDPYFSIDMWLEDHRMEHALRKMFPYINLKREYETAAEKKFADVIRQLDINTLLGLVLSDKDLCLNLLSAYAQGNVKKEDIEKLSIKMRGNRAVRFAMQYLDTAKEIYNAVPLSMDENEINFQQYRALVLLEGMREDFLKYFSKSIKDEISRKRKQSVSIEKQIENVRKAQDAFDRSVGTEKISALQEETMPEVKSKGLLAVLSMIFLMPLKLFMSLFDRFNPPKISYPAYVVIVWNTVQISLLVAILFTASIEAIIILLAVNLVFYMIFGRIMYRVLPTSNPPAWLIKIVAHSGFLRNFFNLLAKLGIVKQPLNTHALGDETSAIGHDNLQPSPFVETVPKQVTLPREGPREPIPESTQNEHMRNISSQQGYWIENLIGDFFTDRPDVGIKLGQSGVLDIDHFALTKDLANSFRSTAVTIEKNPKELVVSGSVGQIDGNFILEEFFMYLFSRGFKVTVYIDDSSYISGINDIHTLKRALAEADGHVSAHRINQDLSRRSRPENYEFTLLEDLQAKIEGVYLYGTFRLFAQGIDISVGGLERADEILDTAFTRLMGKEFLLSTEKEKVLQACFILSNFREMLSKEQTERIFSFLTGKYGLDSNCNYTLFPVSLALSNFKDMLSQDQVEKIYDFILHFVDDNKLSNEHNNYLGPAATYVNIFDAVFVLSKLGDRVSKKKIKEIQRHVRKFDKINRVLLVDIPLFCLNRSKDTTQRLVSYMVETAVKEKNVYCIYDKIRTLLIFSDFVMTLNDEQANKIISVFERYGLESTDRHDIKLASLALANFSQWLSDGQIKKIVNNLSGEMGLGSDNFIEAIDASYALLNLKEKLSEKQISRAMSILVGDHSLGVGEESKGYLDSEIFCSSFILRKFMGEHILSRHASLHKHSEKTPKEDQPSLMTEIIRNLVSPRMAFRKVYEAYRKQGNLAEFVDVIQALKTNNLLSAHRDSMVEFQDMALRDLDAESKTAQTATSKGASAGLDKSVMLSLPPLSASFDPVLKNTPLKSASAGFDRIADAVVRNELFERNLVNYYREFQRRINPSGRNFTVVYGGAGTDISSLLLATGFSRAYFINDHPVSLSRLSQLKEQWYSTLEAHHESYIACKRVTGAPGTSDIKQGAEELLILELRLMGIDKDDVQVDEENSRLLFRVPGESGQREIIFINSDVLALSKDNAFKSKLEAGIDAYFQKGAEILPSSYDKYLADVGSWLRPGGYMMLNNYTAGFRAPNGGFCDPMPFIGDIFSELSEHVQAIELGLNSDPDRHFLTAFEIDSENSHYYGWRLSLYQRKRFVGPVQESMTSAVEREIASEKPASAGTVLEALEEVFDGLTATTDSKHPLIQELFSNNTGIRDIRQTGYHNNTLISRYTLFIYDEAFGGTDKEVELIKQMLSVQNIMRNNLIEIIIVSDDIESARSRWQNHGVTKVITESEIEGEADRLQKQGPVGIIAKPVGDNDMGRRADMQRLLSKLNNERIERNNMRHAFASSVVDSVWQEHGSLPALLDIINKFLDYHAIAATLSDSSNNQDYINNILYAILELKDIKPITEGIVEKIKRAMEAVAKAA
jgi:hypothetical protein